MKKTIIKIIFAVLCTVALCVTIFVCTKTDNTATSYNDYMTEAQAAEYLGISESRLKIMRKNLKYLEGAYMTYSYEENGEMVTVYMYSKDALNETINEMMDDNAKKSINFKYIEDILAKQDK